MTTYAPEPGRETLPGPYDTEPPPDGLRVTPAVLALARAEVRALLESSPSFRELPPERRRRLAHDLVKVAAYSAALYQEEFALSERLDQMPMLVRRVLEPLAGAAEAPLAQTAAAGDAPPPPAADEWSPRAAREVAKVTRATLNAIEFPKFVADLIHGTFDAIVQASIKQMEAYAELVANVAKTVDQFMSDNITDNQARDYLAQTYPRNLKVDTAGDSPKLVATDGGGGSTPDYKTDLGLDSDPDVTDSEGEKTLVTAARRKLAKQRQQMLSAMVMMGVNRIVVTSGRIRAGLTFRIDAHDHATAASASEFDEQNVSATTAWFGFGGGASVNAVTYVSTTKKDSSDDLDVSADLTGEVDIRFKSDYLPLERMATPQMIGAIQGNTPNPAANTPMSGGAKPEQAPAAHASP